MPSIVGSVKITSVQLGAVVQFGDSIQIRTNSTIKTNTGAGSFLIGDMSRTNNAMSAPTPTIRMFKIRRRTKLTRFGRSGFPTL